MRTEKNSLENETQPSCLGTVSGSAIDFYADLMKLINAYCKEGLKKPDLVEKMKYATKSCEMS